MATVAISATASPSQQAGGPPVTQKQPRSRMFRSISRFLSGGTNKQRPKQQAPDLPHAAATHHNNDEPVREQARAEPRRTSSPSRSGSDTEEDDRGGNHHDDGRSTEGEELSTRAVRRFPRNDSVSRYSAVSGADTEASLYAIASTRPGSSLHTVDSSSHASSVAPSGHASTHKSYASTKPTTLLSVDSLGGANRIAVVPGTGTGNYHAASPGGASTGLSFASVLPSTPPQSSPLANAAAGPSGHRRGTSASSSSSFNSYDPAAADPGIAFSIAPDSPSSGTSGPSAERRHDGVNVPNFSHPHPRNNPHPAYPAQDNASILTLASSSFAPSFIGSTGGESKTRTNGWGGGGLGGLHAWSSKQQARSLGGGGGARSLMTPDGAGPSGGVAADEDASVRALPGSRRASNESLGSRSTWSAAPKDATPSVRSRPLDDELAAAAGAGRAASTSPSKKERRTSMRTVETAPSVRSAATADRRETDDDDDGGNGSVHQHDEAASASATEEGTTPAVTDETAASAGDTTLVTHRPGLLSPRRADSDLATTASAAESFRTAPEGAADDDRTSLASSTAAPAAINSHAGEMELAPPVPDIEQGSPDHVQSPPM
jgi:hypothetical protein